MGGRLPPARARVHPAARHALRSAAIVALALPLAACFTDAATRLAYDIEAAAGRVGAAEGSHGTLVHATPSKRGECEGPYRVQLDKAGALIVWCYDATGRQTVSSHSTSYHARFVATPQTIELSKPAREPLRIELERRGGRVIIAGAS